MQQITAVPATAGNVVVVALAVGVAVVNSAIKFARDSSGGFWRPEQIDQASSGIPLAELHCGGCTVPVAAFRSTTLRTGTQRSPHFKIKGARGVIGSHESTCDFHLRTAIRDMLRRTRTVRRSAAGQWEIVVPADINNKPTVAVPTTEDGDAADLTCPSPTSGSGHRLLLLNDIRRVLSLLHHHRDDPDAAGSFAALWQGSSISWDDFYYPPDRHAALTGRVSAAAAADRLVQPVVVSGQVVNIRRPAGQSPTGELLTLHLALTHDTRTPPIRLVVRGDPRHFPPIDDGAAVAVFTQWRSWSPPASPSGVTYCTGWLDWPHRIAVIDPDLLDT